MTWWIMRNVEIWMCLMCLKIKLKRSKHLMWWKRNLNCLLMKVMKFLKKSMIPLHWNQYMTNVSHFWRIFMILLIWILPMMKIMHFFDHLGELVHSPKSYNSMFCSTSLNEVWVKGFVLMGPHEEYGTPRFIFYDDMVGAHYYSHF